MLGLQHYSLYSLLYLGTGYDKYITLYKELITQLHIYAISIRILVKGYLPISLITPSTLWEIISKVKAAMRKTNPDYDFVIDRLHLYSVLWQETSYFSHWYRKKSHNTIPIIYSTVYTTTSNIILNRNCTASNHRSEHTSTILHTPTDKEAIHHFKL